MPACVTVPTFGTLVGGGTAVAVGCGVADDFSVGTGLGVLVAFSVGTGFGVDVGTFAVAFAWVSCVDCFAATITAVLVVFVSCVPCFAATATAVEVVRPSSLAVAVVILPVARASAIAVFVAILVGVLGTRTETSTARTTNAAKTPPITTETFPNKPRRAQKPGRRGRGCG